MADRYWFKKIKWGRPSTRHGQFDHQSGTVYVKVARRRKPRSPLLVTHRHPWLVFNIYRRTYTDYVMSQAPGKPYVLPEILNAYRLDVHRVGGYLLNGRETEHFFGETRLLGYFETIEGAKAYAQDWFTRCGQPDAKKQCHMHTDCHEHEDLGHVCLAEALPDSKYGRTR